MSRLINCIVSLVITLLPFAAFGEETWFGFYMKGHKVGYVNYSTQTEPENPKVQIRKSLMVFDATMLGQDMKIEVQSWTSLDELGKITNLHQLTKSSGRTNEVTAIVNGNTITATMTTNGDKTERIITIPQGAKLIDDPMAELVSKPIPSAMQFDAYVFSTDSLDLQKISIRFAGKSKTDINGKEVDADRVEVNDPRAKLDLFFSAKGDVLKVTGPLGMEYRPEPKQIAMDLTKNGDTGDLALASSVPIKGTIPSESKSVTYQVTGTDLKNIPQDQSQLVKETQGRLLLTITPFKSPNVNAVISEAAKGMEEWTKPDLRVPSNSQSFKQLAKTIIGKENRVYSAGQQLRRFVHSQIKVNAGIGVMRDAKEILESKEGVCRDYTILLGTLTRAAGIPTRFVSGLVYTGQDFLYHAWVEIYDGSNWIALDSTRSEEFITPGHIKTSQGTVGQGITGFLLDGAKFEVVSINRP